MDARLLAEKMVDIYGVNVEEGIGSTIINQCVKKISEEYPKIQKSYIETVEGQERYTVTHDGLIKVCKVHYNTTATTDEVVTDINIPYSGSLSSQFTTIFEQEMYDRMNPVDASIVNYNEFDLIPAPTVTGMKVYYEYESYRTIDEIPEIFEDEFIKLYFFYERENEFRKTMRANNGNVFAFDRRGNIQAGGAAGDENGTKARESEFNDIIKCVRNIIMRLKR